MPSKRKKYSPKADAFGEYDRVVCLTINSYLA